MAKEKLYVHYYTRSIKYTVKNGLRFFVQFPNRDVTNQTLPGQGIVKLFPARESLVIDIPSGDSKIAKLFLQCNTYSVFSIQRCTT